MHLFGSGDNALAMIVVAVAVALAGIPVGARAANVDADAAIALAKANGCFKCHSIEKTKTGPSYKEVAAKYKGKPDGEEKLIKHFTTGPKVKLKDGTEVDHMIIGTKDPKVLRNLANWILSR